MAWVAWCTKMTVAPTRVIGVMDDGMAMVEPPLPMAIRTTENIDSINVMDVASTVGPISVFMMENLVKISVMEREPLSGRMVQRMPETFIKDNAKDMDDTPSRMEDTMWEVGWMDDMKDLVVCAGLILFA